ncbi:hypothetical protein C8J57DRAFT_1346803 [Mycena rebaudengoi]|nr:hypothetical protein C8J57DRAFT_1346803 [Mycena rebaudengoi]
MLSLFRLRTPAVLRLGPLAALRSATAAPNANVALARSLMTFCQNCRLEGHTTRTCPKPVVCVVCGIKGHASLQRKHCPNRDQARIDVPQTAPKKCVAPCLVISSLRLSTCSPNNCPNPHQARLDSLQTAFK